ncbi:MAG: nitrogen fixation protein NifM [gamma proteobacterium symbiont of Bathyaustriella thionipta]|nr:nitrogen fixation protein NifM [gamma proteobacterium symbiont of Bathyaustriella thionipta]MCU7950236.1 nitrogen fixation protein NifM [gamma proteobacterium symbiont of Bathyaustriella thionipta]MCU7952172.1 nitrogen fixation protein NifM [gamma proteobacterium symbiont of Bathyaustriella thionipta]MCU7956771.1 nitrogen fixation protein NifM [gamma proteobacterium symbiont of Bathyaustriella thionipta]
MRKPMLIQEQTQELSQEEHLPEFNYHMLRYALDVFKKNTAQLMPDEYDSVYYKAKKSFDLESLVIESPEAEGVIIPAQQIEESFSAVASRYESHADLIQDLKTNALDEVSLRQAIYRELLFDSIMQRVSANIKEVTEVDIQLFYEMHRERFDTPEMRLTRHILITINPEFDENTYQAALDKIIDIADKLNGRSNRFHAFAKRFSECPTAMEGGKLGNVVKGQLYPELDSELFNLEENEISQIVETEMGFHLLLCEKIRPEKKVQLSKVSERIRLILEQRNQRNYQKKWFSELKSQLD